MSEIQADPFEIYENCGTYAGAMKHTRERTPKCDGCRRAQREYIREYRSDATNREAERVRARARDRAVWKLVKGHHDEFRELFDAELTVESHG